MEDDVMLSTIDNPYNPFTNWDEWLAYDIAMGHQTCEYLAKVCFTSDSLSEADQKWDESQAIDKIVKDDPFGIYIKVTKNMGENGKMACDGQKYGIPVPVFK